MQPGPYGAAERYTCVLGRDDGEWHNAYQISSPLGAALWCGPDTFPDLISSKPWCSNDPKHEGLVVRARPIALQKRYVQANSPRQIRFLQFDIDRFGAYSAAEEANLPFPSFVSTTPESGRGLITYALSTPVRMFDGSSRKPIDYLAAIERGLRRRLKADPGYCGLIGKNPLHPRWRTDWQRP
jgi:hypothetical protein